MFFILGGDGKEYGPVSVAKIQEWMIALGRANLQTKACARAANIPSGAPWAISRNSAAPPSPRRRRLAPAVSSPPALVAEPATHRPLAGLGARFGAATT